MDLLERIIYFSIGGGVGFILGFIAARLRVVETKVDRVEKEVQHVDQVITRDKGERGVMKLPALRHIALLIVVMLTVFAAVMTGKVNGELDHTVQCLTKFNTDQNLALNSRDDAIRAEADAEIQLWGLYNRLYKEGSLPNTPPERLKELQETLAQAIREYREQLIDTQKARDKYAYGEPDVLKNCEEKLND